MDIVEKIKNVNKKQKQLGKDILLLLEEFTTYIKDKKIPLKDRWNLFKEAPDDLSVQLDSFPEFHYKKLGKGLKFFTDVLLIEEHVKGFSSGSNTLNLKEIVSGYCNDETDEIEIDPEMVRFSIQYNEQANYTDKEIVSLVLQLMEDILKLNLVSFDFDS